MIMIKNILNENRMVEREVLDVKKKLYIILIISMISLIITSCNKISVVIDDNKSNTDRFNYTQDNTDEKTSGEKSLIFEGFLLIDNQPILSMTYDEVLNCFGEPKETRIEKFTLPAAPTPTCTYFAVLCYEGIEISFYLSMFNNLEEIKPTQPVWNFDLTSDKYSIGELRVDMSVKEYLKKFENSKMYSMIDINLSNLDSSLGGIDYYKYNALKTILINSKPKDYYAEYDYVFYEQGIAEKSPVGLALLIKDSKIDRIVYGFPNAS